MSNSYRMSCNLPIVFDRFKYGSSFYIDGGIINNFPIDLVDINDNRVLGVVVDNSSKGIDTTSYEMNSIGYIYHLTMIPVNRNVMNNINTCSKNCDIVKVMSNKTGFLSFNLSIRECTAVYTDGYKIMHEFINSQQHIKSSPILDTSTTDIINKTEKTDDEIDDLLPVPSIIITCVNNYTEDMSDTLVSEK